MSATLLAIDPSITAPGFAVLDLSRAEPHLLAAGVWHTAPETGAKRSDDNMRRALYVWRELRRTIADHQPLAIAIESGAGSKNAKTAIMLGMAQAVAACAADEHLNRGAPIYVTAIDAGTVLGIQRTQRRKKGEPKKTSSESARDRKARKAAVAHAVVGRLGHRAWYRALDLAPTSDEHEDELELVLHPGWEGAHDAAAIALAAWERPEVAGLRMIARQTKFADFSGGAA